MNFYFGTELLKYLKAYYENRLHQAIDRGFDEPKDRYHWLYLELEHRVNTLRRLLTLIDALPGFICNRGPDALTIVAERMRAWFAPEISDGALPCPAIVGADEQSEDSYWKDYQDAMARFNAEYNFTDVSGFYLDLVESLVMAVRLYFHVRESQLRPIDREKFDELVSINSALSKSALEVT